MYHCMIVDNDEFFLDTLAGMVETFPDFRVMKEIRDSRHALRYLITLEPDVVFLNMKMQGKAVFEEINELEISTRVILTMDQPKDPFDVFCSNAPNCLYKPFDRDELGETLKEIKEESFKYNIIDIIPDKTQIAFTNTRGTIMLEVGNILYIHSAGYHTHIYDIYNRPVIKSKNLGEVRDRFPNSFFFKISQSATVNMNFISSIDHAKGAVILNVNGGESVSLQASKERLYDLEELMIKNLN